MKRLIVSGAIAVGAAGIVLGAAPAQAGTAEFSSDKTANEILAVGRLVKAAETLGDGHPVAPRPVGRPIARAQATTGGGEPLAETEGHEPEVYNKNNCRGNWIRANVHVRNSKNTLIKFYGPSKVKCKVKAKTSANSSGDVKSKGPTTWKATSARATS